MKSEIVSGNLVRLRQTNNYTQDDLASKLNVSRQAISKWETGSSIPSIDTLLILSKLFGISINEILEPQWPFITHFEDLISLNEDIITDALSSTSSKTIVTALMGASPAINKLVKKLMPEIDYSLEREQLGILSVIEVENKQDSIIEAINFQLCKKQKDAT